MTGNMRQGIGLAVLGVALLLVGIALDNQLGMVIRGVGGGLVLVGLVATAVALLKPERD